MFVCILRNCTIKKILCRWKDRKKKGEKEHVYEGWGKREERISRWSQISLVCCSFVTLKTFSFSLSFFLSVCVCVRVLILSTHTHTHIGRGREIKRASWIFPVYTCFRAGKPCPLHHHRRTCGKQRVLTSSGFMQHLFSCFSGNAWYHRGHRSKPSSWIAFKYAF